MSAFSDALGGLRTILEANITGIHVYDFPADAVHEFPAAVLLAESFDPRIAFGGNSFEGRIRAVFLVSDGLTQEGFAKIYDMIDPTTTNQSVVKAVNANPTLNGKVDSAGVVLIENIGKRTMWGGEYAGFDAVIEYVKSVT